MAPTTCVDIFLDTVCAFVVLVEEHTLGVLHNIQTSPIYKESFLMWQDCERVVNTQVSAVMIRLSGYFVMCLAIG